MFKNQPYLTKGVNERIPLLTQLFLWNLIENMSVEKDYAQFFYLSEENGRQKIVHKQEHPEYQREYLLDTKPVTETVFVIDDGSHTTMLLGRNTDE